MRLIGLVVILALGLSLAPLTVETQEAGKVYRIGVLASSTEANFEPSVKVFREASHAAGWVEGRNLTLDVRYPGDQYARLQELANELVKLKVDVRQRAELGAAFETMRRERTDALVLVADPLLFSARPLIIQLAARHRLPTVYETRLFPEGGGLLSYGPLAQERFQRMAVYVDRILRGAQPGEMPVERPTTFELVINLKTAKALGLTIPPSVLGRADQVIE